MNNYKHARTNGSDYLFKCMLDEMPCDGELAKKCFFMKPRVVIKSLKVGGKKFKASEFFKEDEK